MRAAELGETEGQPIYADEKPSETAQAALKFCFSYQQQVKSSETLFRQIADSGVLESRRADVTLPDGTKRVIDGFHVVSEEKLGKLEDEVFLGLRKTAALNLIYCQLWSARSWKQII